MTRLTQEQYDRVCNIIDTIKITKSKKGYYDAQYYPKGDYAKKMMVENIPGCLPPQFIEYSIDPDECIGVFISEKHRVAGINENSYLPMYPIMIAPLYKIEELPMLARIKESLEDSDYEDPVIKCVRFVLVDGTLMPLCSVEF